MRIIALLLVVLLSFTMTACQKEIPPDTSPEYNFETDCQYYNYIAEANGYLAETADSIYYMENRYLRVIDKETMKDSFLCGKPDCLHDADDDGQSEQEKTYCNAFVKDSHGLDLCYYEGYLYEGFTISELEGYSSVRTPTFVRFSLDGSSRKNIWEIEWEKESNDLYQKMFMHRGEFHFLVEATENEETFLGDKAYAYDLTTKKVSLLCEFPPHQFVMHRYALGNHLYFLVYDATIEDTHTYRYDMSTEEMEKLDYVKQVVPVGNQLIYTCADVSGTGDDGTVDYWMEISNLDGANRREYAIEYLSEEDSQGKQLQVYEDKLFITSGIFPTQVEVYDFCTGKLAHLIDIPAFAYEGNRCMSCTQDGKLILYNTYCLADVQDIEKFYCDISAIGTDNFQWHAVEKIN